MKLKPLTARIRFRCGGRKAVGRGAPIVGSLNGHRRGGEFQRQRGPSPGVATVPLTSSVTDPGPTAPVMSSSRVEVNRMSPASVSTYCVKPTWAPPRRMEPPSWTVRTRKTLGSKVTVSETINNCEAPLIDTGTVRVSRRHGTARQVGHEDTRHAAPSGSVASVSSGTSGGSTAAEAHPPSHSARATHPHPIVPGNTWTHPGSAPDRCPSRSPDRAPPTQSE